MWKINEVLRVATFNSIIQIYFYVKRAAAHLNHSLLQSVYMNAIIKHKKLTQNFLRVFSYIPILNTLILAKKIQWYPCMTYIQNIDFLKKHFQQLHTTERNKKYIHKFHKFWMSLYNAQKLHMYHEYTNIAYSKNAQHNLKCPYSNFK